MSLLKDDYTKEEKINAVVYDMSPSPNYQHGIVDGNIYRIISTGLQGTVCLAFMEVYTKWEWKDTNWKRIR